jgi:hypothetical protein
MQLVKSKRRHMIGMEVPRGGSSCTSCRYLVDAFGRRTGDGRYCSLAMWVNAPKRDGGGGGDPELPLPANRWCCDGYEIRGTRENPLSMFGDLTPFETVLVIGGGGAVLMGLTLLLLKAVSSSQPAVAALPPTPGVLDVTGPPGQTATNLLPPPGTTVPPPVYLPGGSPLPVAPTA